MSSHTEQKTHLTRKDLQCCLQYPISDCVLTFLNGEAGLYVFVLCCISACFPKTEASIETDWMALITDVNKLKKSINGSDAILYSGTSIKDKHICRNVVLWCYLKEMEIIVRESKILGKVVDDEAMIFLWENSYLSKIISTCPHQLWAIILLANIKGIATVSPAGLTRVCLVYTHAETGGNEHCLPCEMYPEKAYIDFIEDLTEFLQELNTQAAEY
ncbi:interleukin-15 isoform X2 [Pleurodeles waltl]|uniref:interleukin-15 isoform X2 n=1 Tax=Pleurodeles waltl TaxID=8319 RepID=UPI003709AA6C